MPTLQEQRRHQRIRFAIHPPVAIGFGGQVGEGRLENLSATGLMVRTGMPLKVGVTFGCEFSLSAAAVDVAATVTNRVGDLVGARFKTGPLSQILIDQSVASAMASGQASVLGVHELSGRKVMRVAGGLNGSLRADFIHGLQRMGIEGLDMSGVSVVDKEGIALCILAVRHFGAKVEEESHVFHMAWNAARRSPEWLNPHLLAEMAL